MSIAIRAFRYRRGGLTVILGLHTRHHILHQILTRHSEFLQVQQLANSRGGSFRVFLGDHEDRGWDGGLGCLRLEEELMREGKDDDY